MKKQAVFVVLMLALLISGTVSAQFIVDYQWQKTEDIDNLWKKAPFLNNSLPDSAQITVCDGGGVFRSFVGKTVDGVDVRMCMIDMPDSIFSQTTSLQLVVNNIQKLSCPIKLYYQVFSEPKYINGEIVVRASSGMPNSDDQHFYLVINKTGDWHTTEVRYTK